MFIYVMLHEAVLHKCMKLIPLSPLNQTPQPISGTCFFFSQNRLQFYGIHFKDDYHIVLQYKAMITSHKGCMGTIILLEYCVWPVRIELKTQLLRGILQIYRMILQHGVPQRCTDFLRKIISPSSFSHLLLYYWAVRGEGWGENSCGEENNKSQQMNWIIFMLIWILIRPPCTSLLLALEWFAYRFGASGQNQLSSSAQQL